MQLLKVRIGNKIFKIKDCKGLSSLRGLMFDDMKNKDGAFIYANWNRWTRNASVCIWMPFVRKNLNLVFLDEKMKVIKSEIALPLSTSKKTWKVYSDSKAKYCLELKDTKLNAKKGTRIKLFK